MIEAYEVAAVVWSVASGLLETSSGHESVTLQWMPI